MKRIWKKEETRGAVPRYWEDVAIGDKPALTQEGPLIECALPAPFGHGIGGTRTMKKEILDEDIYKTMIKDKHGICRLPNPADYTRKFPTAPDPPLTLTTAGKAS